MSDLGPALDVSTMNDCLRCRLARLIITNKIYVSQTHIPFTHDARTESKVSRPSTGVLARWPMAVHSHRMFALYSLNTLSRTLLHLCSFEKTLKQKLSQKASGNANEETVLLKAFKYFDLNNNGTVEPDEFAKACEKIGIMIPTRQVSNR